MDELTTGAAYRFKVVAFNFNGQGQESASSIHYSCAKPGYLPPPQLVSTTQQYMTLSWTEPHENGGCPITGFQLFRDDGLTGVPTE